MASSSSGEPLQACCPVMENHPVLRRHYSTIGIGDVFVQQQAPSNSDCHGAHDGQQRWLLPSAYFSASTKNGNESTDAAQLPPKTMLLCEMIGNIKNTPEDFLVREMAVVRGNVRVADPALASDLSLQQQQPQHQHVVVESITTQPRSLNAAPDEGKNIPPGDAKEGQTKKHLSPDREVRATKADETVARNMDDASRLYNNELVEDPMERLKSVLVKHHVQNVNDALQQSPEELFRALKALEMEALDTIQQLANPVSASPALMPSELLLSFSAHANTDVQQQKKERGEIYEAIRHALPLLKAECTATAEPATDNCESQIRVTLDDCWFSLVLYLYAPVEDLPPLYAFAKRGYEHAQQQQQQQQQATKKYAAIATNDGRGSGREQSRGGSRGRRSTHGPILRLKPDLPRSERRPVHQTIDSKFKGMLGTDTLNAYPLQPSGKDKADTTTTTTAIEVHWTSVAARKICKKRTREESNGNAAFVPKATYLLCVVRKRQKEHLAMINTLSAGFRCRSSDIGLAGIKDMQAVTYQFCTLNRFEPQRINASGDYFRQRGIDVVPLYNVDRALGRGDLLGNRFEIVVRNLRRVQLSYTSNNAPHESFVPVDEPHLKERVDCLRTGGFVNFFGEQRVGHPGHESVAGVRAFDIGRAMLQQDFSKAIDLLMTGRRIVNGFEMLGDDVDLFRRTWRDTGGDSVATAKHLPPGGISVPRERAVLKGLTRYGKDNPLAALRCLQRNERLFFISAVRQQLCMDRLSPLLKCSLTTNPSVRFGFRSISPTYGT